jgi:hypothetical protein
MRYQGISDVAAVGLLGLQQNMDVCFKYRIKKKYIIKQMFWNKTKEAQTNDKKCYRCVYSHKLI